MKKARTQYALWRLAFVATLGCVFYVSLTQITPLCSYAFGQEKSSRAHIGFGSVTSDDAILKLLQRYDIVPEAGFMWTSGLTGTHRTYKTKNAQAFLDEMRTRVAHMFEKALRGNQVRLEHFLKIHTEEKIVASRDLQGEARSLLNIRASLEAGVVAVIRGEPLIFSMEVSGDPTQIEHLITDKMVKKFERGREVRGKVVVPHPPKPAAYQEEYLDPGIQTMSAQELYRSMSILTSVDTKGGV